MTNVESTPQVVCVACLMNLCWCNVLFCCARNLLVFSLLLQVHSKVTQKLGLPQQYFFSPAIVAQYVVFLCILLLSLKFLIILQQYSVIKINKFGKRQERIMGIDSERITNCLPPNSKTGKTHTVSINQV